MDDPLKDLGTAQVGTAQVIDAYLRERIPVILEDTASLGMRYLARMAHPPGKLTQDDVQDALLITLEHAWAGFVDKPASYFDAVLRNLEKRRWAPRRCKPLTQAQCEELCEETPTSLSPEDLAAALSPEELSICRALGQGVPRQEIVDSMGFSMSTFERRMRGIREKMEALLKA